MKRTRPLLASTFVLAACSVGGSAWSPIACACAEPWQSLSAALDLGIDDHGELTAPLVEQALARRVVGTRIDIAMLPVLDRPSGCTPATDARAIVCDWWLWQAGDARRGFNATIALDRDGVAREVRVVDRTDG